MSEDMDKVDGLKVIQAGVCCTVQDLGRYGYATHGLSQGGPIDLQAHCWVNRLLGNEPDAATIEIAVGMASFQAQSDLLLAICGADMRAEIDGNLVGNWRSFPIQRGQTLKLHPAREGLRGYIGLKGGVQTEPIMESCSVVVRNGVGSLLTEGEVLPALAVDPVNVAHVPARYVPNYPATISLRVIESYQACDFSPEALSEFYHAEYEVTPELDRMGVKLKGNQIKPPNDGIISEGIALGAIQVPNDGQPIVLLNDRQTLGGYPKLGVVARVDLPKLGQAGPGTKVQFSPVTLGQAQQEWRQFCDYFLSV